MIPTSPIFPIRHPASPAAFTVVAWSLLTRWMFAWLLGVLSNLPLVLAGAAGFWCLRGSALAQPTSHALRTFFAGLVLSGMGSVIYHWAPDAGTLVIDRLGMAVVSAVLPHLQGNVLPWVVVQFGGMGLVVWAATRSSVQGALGVSLAGLIALYALAKPLELGDETVFHATGDWVSGHSLKHVAAACAALPILAGLRRRGLGDNAPVHPSAMG